MQFDLIPILSTVIMATTIVTIILAFGSYAAYKLRDKKRARVGRIAAEDETPPPVFRRYQRRGHGARAVDGDDPGR